jgi:hypothetical protein
MLVEVIEFSGFKHLLPANFANANSPAGVFYVHFQHRSGMSGCRLFTSFSTADAFANEHYARHFLTTLHG